MLFWIERKGKRVFVDALLNRGRYIVTFWEDGRKISPKKYSWLIPEAKSYLRLFTDKPIEFNPKMRKVKVSKKI
jgi:hypothetical protein